MSSSLILLVGLALISVVSTQTPLRSDVIKAKLESYKGCHTGLLGMSDEGMEAAKRCDAMNIAEMNCYMGCFLREKGVIQGDKFSEDGAHKCMKKMWAPDQPSQLAGEKWYLETKKCAQAYEKSGGKWPSPPYEGTCKEMDTPMTCVQTSRECPAKA